MIPHILHRVWPGDGVPGIPEEFERYWLKWAKLHPLWELKTWDGTELKLAAQDFYDLQDNFGAMSDILRLEVLKRFGGVYVDTDMEPLGSIEPITDSMKCFAGAQIGGGPTNAIMGCERGHLAIQSCLTALAFTERRKLKMSEVTTFTGPDLLERRWRCRADVSIIDQSILGCRPEEVQPDTLVVHHRTSRWANKKLVDEFSKSHAAV